MTQIPPTTAPPRPTPSKPGKGGMIRSSLIFSALTLVSRFMGLARDLVITARLGASLTIAADAYYTALAFPNLFRRIFAEGAFAAAFIPTYSKTLAREGEEGADRLAADALASLAAITVGLTVIFQLAMPWLMYVINPGYADDPAKFRLAIILTQITMPYLPCMAIAALFSGVLNARGRFVISGLYPTILNVVMLAVVWPQTDPIRAAYAASIGVGVAGVAQAALVWWGANKSGARIGLRAPKLTPEVKGLLKLAAPAVIANSATQINLFISGVLASQVAGARVWMNVADRLYQLPMSLVGVAIGVALLPRLSKALQTQDHDDAQTAMDQAMVFALAFSLPAAAALMAMPVYLIDALFTRGAFLPSDAAETGTLLFHYGWGVPAFVMLRILQPAFFARSDTKTPMRFSLISVGVNIALGLLLFQIIGVAGIAAATGIAAWLSVAQMVLALRRRGEWSPSKAALGKMLRVLAASAALFLVLAAAAHFRELIEAPLDGVAFAGFHAKEISVLAVVAVGAVCYPLLLFAFGGLTMAELRGALKRKKSDPAPLPAA